MGRRHWNKVRATSLREGIELCLEYARTKHNRSVDHIADLMGVQSKWTIYKWMQTGRLPSNLIRPFEHACGATFVTQYIATSAHRLLVAIPKGQPAAGADIQALQAALTEASGQLLNYYAGEVSAEEALVAIDQAMGSLAYQRGNVERGCQPELALDDNEEGSDE